MVIMNSKNEENKGDEKNLLKKNKYFVLITGIVIIILLTGSSLISNIGNKISDAEASDFASLSILKWNGEPQNPKLPVQHVSQNSIETSKSKIAQIIFNEEKRYNPHIREHLSSQISLNKAEALAIMDTIPFTYNDDYTFPGYEGHSANIEVDGKYYQVILLIQK